MTKKNNRFENMEIESEGVSKKPSLLDKSKFKRKLELGNEAYVENADQKIKEISADLDEKIKANELRRAIRDQHVMTKNIEDGRINKLRDLEMRQQQALGVQKIAKRRIWFIVVLTVIGVAILSRVNKGMRNELLFELIVPLILGVLGFRTRRRWWR